MAKIVLLVTTLSSLLLACTSPPRNDPAALDGLASAIKMNFDQTSVEEAMEVKGIKYELQSPKQEWRLAGVAPITYAVSNVRESPEPEAPEEASVYIFSSERHREDGLADFRKQTERYNMVVPRIYEKRNVLILYWALGDRNEPSKLGEKFTNAVNSLHVVTEFNRTTTGSKKVPFTILVEVKPFGGIAFKKGASISSVDTHFSGRAHAIQIRGWRLPSAIDVEYHGSEISIRYKESAATAKENVLLHSGRRHPPLFISSFSL